MENQIEYKSASTDITNKLPSNNGKIHKCRVIDNIDEIKALNELTVRKSKPHHYHRDNQPKDG